MPGGKIHLRKGLQRQGIPGVLTVQRYIKQLGKLLARAYISLKYSLKQCMEVYEQRSGYLVPSQGW